MNSINSLSPEYGCMWPYISKRLIGDYPPVIRKFLGMIEIQIVFINYSGFPQIHLRDISVVGFDHIGPKNSWSGWSDLIIDTLSQTLPFSNTYHHKASTMELIHRFSSLDLMKWAFLISPPHRLKTMIGKESAALLQVPIAWRFMGRIYIL